jgi:hypothetical protein
MCLTGWGLNQRCIWKVGRTDGPICETHMQCHARAARQKKKGRKRIVRFEMHALEVAGGENAELDVTVMMLKEKRDRVETEIDTNPPAQFS